MCSTATIFASSARQEDKEEKSDLGDLGPDFDLGFISHAQFDTTLNQDVVRYMMFSGWWSRRIGKLHTYLSNNLPVYSATCCAIYPPANLMLPVPVAPK